MIDYSSFLFNIGIVRHFNTVNNSDMVWRPGIHGLRTRIHTGVYVEKCVRVYIYLKFYKRHLE